MVDLKILKIAPAALLVLLTLAYTFSDSEIRWSAPGLPTCSGHPCLDAPNGLRIVDRHITHLAGIWNFVEGLGHPGMTTFYPVARRLSPARYDWPDIYRDPIARNFSNLASDFLRHGSHMDSYLSILVMDMVHQFRRMCYTLKRVQHTLIEFQPSQTSHAARPTLSLEYQEIETDKIFNSTLVQLEIGLKSLCMAALDKSEILTPLALNVSIIGSELDLESELARVDRNYKDLPWWDSWTIDHWLGTSGTAQLGAYLQFFRREEQTFRALATASSALQDNIVGLREYCIWYTDNTTSLLINEAQSRDEILKPVTPYTIAQDIENLSGKVEDAWSAAQPNGLPGWPPRAVRPPPGYQIA
ncbi:hypothetical protein C8R47DRAFT_1132953 [Mycena vitilis]|nr:hypothetical protein C8R47DRAFT_1132953 [Mycena vitilis]